MLQRVVQPSSSLLIAPFRRLTLCERRDIYCLVDPEDYDWALAWGWNIGWHNKTKWKFYAKRNEGPARLTVYLHREILKRATGCDIDFAAAHHGHHVNGQSLDNRRVNLQWLPPKENSAIRERRDNIPTLESIEARLMLEAGLAPTDLPPF